MISANFIDQIADPASRFYQDYLAYRADKITQGELVGRLPHVSMIGDSVCMDVYISSAWSTFWRAHTRRGGNWFFDGAPAPDGVYSVSKRLQELTPFVATEYAGIGALVDDGREGLTFFRRILGTQNFSGQISQLLSAPRFPDLILTSIGHNNVDWAWRCPRSELADPEKRLRQLSCSFRQRFARQMRRLTDRARRQQYRVAIVVYGLINFEAYFNGRAAAERLRAEDRRLYPHLETTYRYFSSFRPDYRRQLIRLAAMFNAELRAMVDELNSEFESICNLEIRYSDALSRADLSRVELLHEIDGWHASREGHNVLAAAAFSDLVLSLEFLGIKSSSANLHQNGQDRQL